MKSDTQLNAVMFVVVVMLLTVSTAFGQNKDVPSGAPRESVKKSRKPARPRDEVGNPYVIFRDKFQELGPAWMPDGNIKLNEDPAWARKPHEGKKCYRALCSFDKNSWMAVAFLPGGKFAPELSVNVAKKLRITDKDPVVLRFWARAPKRVECQFKVGGIPKDSIVFAIQSKWIRLTESWQMYTIDLTGEDLSALRAAFIWVIEQPEHNPGLKRAEFLLDNIYITKVKNRPDDDATINE